MELFGYFNEVLETIKQLGGLSWGLQVSAIIMLVVGSMKVTLLRQLVWDKLGALKALAAPVLGLLAGLATQIGGAEPFSAAKLLAFLVAGAGSVALYELLSVLKAMPVLGPKYQAIIELLMKLLGAKKQ